MNAAGITMRDAEWRVSAPPEPRDIARKTISPLGLASPAKIAVLVPCRNEETTIAKVVGDFIAALPQATIYVYDNDSSDGTAARANAAGAVVSREPLPGKGNVVRRMFAGRRRRRLCAC